MKKATGRRVYARGNKLWIRYADATGKTKQRGNSHGRAGRRLIRARRREGATWVSTIST